MLLATLIFVAALLYSSVGHAGASGYLAAMALYGIAPAVMKPTALVLNILVATIATIEFYRAGYFDGDKLKPLVITSIPCAFIGGGLSLPAQIYKPLIGVVLLFAAARMLNLFLPQNRELTGELKPLPWQMAMAVGAIIGLLSGLTGVGGGIFLSPLMLLMKWAEAKQTAGISAAFILVNSIAGLLGNFSKISLLPMETPLWAIAAIGGGFLGARFGSHHFNDRAIRRMLAVVLIIAGMKAIFAQS
jgi:uncharacterized protein